MTTDAAIRVRGLQKAYNEMRVVRCVDFDVAQGSIFAPLGSNGAAIRAARTARTAPQRRQMTNV